MYARRQCFGTTWVGDYREEIDRSDRRYPPSALSPPILTRVPPIEVGEEGMRAYREDGGTGMTGRTQD